MDVIQCSPQAESHDSGLAHQLAVFSVQQDKAVLLGEGTGNGFFAFNWDLLGHQYIEPELVKHPKEWKALHEWAENGLRRHLDVIKGWKQLSGELDYLRLGFASAGRGGYWSHRVSDAYAYLLDADYYLHDLAHAEEFPLPPHVLPSPNRCVSLKKCTCATAPPARHFGIVFKRISAG